MSRHVTKTLEITVYSILCRISDPHLPIRRILRKNVKSKMFVKSLKALKSLMSLSTFAFDRLTQASRARADPGGSIPPSLACAILNFLARGCWRSDIPRSLHPSALSTELLKVSELPHLSLTLTLAQPRCNCKCNLTLTLDSHSSSERSERFVRFEPNVRSERVRYFSERETNLQALKRLINLIAVK